MCSMVCFTSIGVSSLVDRRLFVYTTVSLRMNPRDSKHVGQIENYILIYKIVYFVGFCCIIVQQCTVQKINKQDRNLLKLNDYS